MVLRGLRLCALALVVGAVSQAPAHQAAGRLIGPFSPCAAMMVDQLRTAWPEGQDGVYTCHYSAGGRALPNIGVSVRDGDPRVGETCEDVQYERVAFVITEDGEVTATFTLFGGLSRGTLAVSPGQERMIDGSDAYVTQVQLGSYERAADEQRGGLACHVNPMYHFYCLATRTLDQLCLTWLRHRRHSRQVRS